MWTEIRPFTSTIRKELKEGAWFARDEVEGQPDAFSLTHEMMMTFRAGKRQNREQKTGIAMCFPDVYEIGMSHLGIQILYDMLNMEEDIWCERVYSPWPDLDRIMREKKIPLFALESQDPVKDFDFLGITIQYEMCYTNILQILELSGIPLRAADRGENDPIVIGGGPCTYNPEPLADFFDLFYIGEGETVIRCADGCLYQDKRETGGSRQDFLREAAGFRGSMCPRCMKSPIRKTVRLRFLRSEKNRMFRQTVRKEIVRWMMTIPLSGKAGRPFYPAHPGPRGAGDPAGLHPRLPLLPGRHDLPPGAGAEALEI